MRDVLRAVAAVAEAGAVAVVMSYWNPVERYGVERFAADLAAAGGAGAITPDLIPDEAGAVDRGRRRSTASTGSSSSRRPRPTPGCASTTAACRGFVYAASTMGVTGARAHGQRRRRDAGRPHPGVGADLAGLRRPRRLDGAQAAEVAAFADGVIVGSAFVRELLEGRGPEGVRAYCREAPGEGRPRMILRHHPEPDPGRLEPRPAADPRLRALHRGGHRRRDPAHRASLAGPRRSAGRRARHRRLGGAVRHRRRPALPRDHQPAGLLRRAAATRSGPSRSGRAASASGARSPSAGSAPGSPAGGAASRCRPSPTRWRPGCWSRRRSAGWATGSTTSSTAGPTHLPWALKIYAWDGGKAVVGADGHPVVLGTFHPTFLYELLWNLAAAAFVIWADRRFRLGHGRAFALYVASYCLGRLWVELLRTDPADHFFGIRLNVFTAVDRRPRRGRLLRRTCAAGRARSSPGVPTPRPSGPRHAAAR